MKGYGEYKRTSEFWLAQIPAQWNFKKIKRIFSERIEKGHPDKPLLAATQNKGVVLKKDYGSRTVEATKDLHLLKLVRTGDFVISLRSFQGGIEYAHVEGIISPAYTVMIPVTNIVHGYFKYFAKIPCFLDLLKSSVTGIREGQNIDYKKLREHFIPLPPREEQDQIVRYLDAKVGKINKLIRIKQQQIVLFKESIYSELNRLVQSSNKIALLKRIVLLESNFVEISHDKLYSKAGMYNRGRGIFSRPPVLGKDMGNSKFQEIFANRLMISGQFAWEGAASITQKKDTTSVVSHRYYLLAVRDKTVSIEYVWAYLTSDAGIKFLNRCSHGAAGRNKPLNVKELLCEGIPVLPLKEQKTIKGLVCCLESFVEQTNFMLSALTEYRTRLISDVVTGKVDVRNIPIADEDILPEMDADVTLEGEIDETNDDLMAEA